MVISYEYDNFDDGYDQDEDGQPRQAMSGMCSSSTLVARTERVPITGKFFTLSERAADLNEISPVCFKHDS